MSSEAKLRILSESVATILHRLETLRHVRSFDLEKRLSPFLLPYLSRAVESYMRDVHGMAIQLRHDIFLAEFPYTPVTKKGRPRLVDFVFFGRARSDSSEVDYVFPLELKTDMASLVASKKCRRDRDTGELRSQLSELTAWQNKAFSGLLDIVLTVVRKSDVRAVLRKNHHLCHALRELGYIDIGPLDHVNLRQADFGKIRVERKRADHAKVNVVWVVPESDHACGLYCITFDWFACYLRKHHKDDFLAQKLACCLTSLAKEKAGKKHPSTIHE